MRCGVLTLTLVLLAGLPAGAQVNRNTPGWFPFTFSGFDAQPTAVDLSYLNTKPAGRDGFLRVEDGVLKDGAGRRVRWFGFNIAGESAWPSKTDAPRLAARLAKLGVNIVRLHHMDYTWGPGSLMNYPASNAIRPEPLDRLDFFIAELKKQGIYVNLNLHVSRTYPGTPAGYDFSKGLDHFYPPFIDLFKRFARDILLHRNPYTNTLYTQEPAIACIEVNNENTLGMFPPTQLASLLEPFAGELKRQWTTWLRAKYATTDGLRAAWGINDGQVGPNLVKNPDFANRAQGWNLENHNGAQSVLTPIPDGTPGIRWSVTRTATENWHVQMNTAGLNLTEGQPYRVRFRARAQAAHPLDVAVMLDQDPWTGCGLSARADLTTAWQEFSYPFVATGTRPNHVRVNLSAVNQLGVIDIAGVALEKLSGGALRPDETFENNNLPLTASSGNQTAKRDFTQFLIETERGHAQEMHRYIQQELGARQIIYHSQLPFGGMAGALRERRASDLADSHAYWQHPQFPGQPWDPANWLITNSSQLADTNGGVLAGMAIQRVQGMPFTVSEYNHPAPSDYTAETWPLLATIAGFQDWDGLYFFEYVSFTNNYDEDRIRGFFSAQGHPAQEAFTPLAALLFRTGMVKPAAQTVVLTTSEQRIVNDQADSGMWGSFERFWSRAGAPQTVALKHRTALNLVPGDAPTALSFQPTLPASGPITSDTGEITWDAAQRLLTLNAPAVRLLLGKVGGKSFTVGDVSFQVGSLGGNEHAHLGLVALDGQPIATSGRLLLIALGRAENQDMGWNATRTSVSNKWGSGPAVVQGVTATVTLAQGGWTVAALDPTGAPVQTLARDAASVAISPSQRTVWYLLTR